MTQMSDILSLQITNSFKIPVDTRYDWYILLMSIDEMKETHYKNINLNPPELKIIFHLSWTWLQGHEMDHSFSKLDSGSININ